jgi:uncharacterized membrane protein
MRIPLTRPRLTIAAVLFAILFGLLVDAWGPTRSLLISFDVVATIFLGATFHMMRRATPEYMPGHAAAQLRGRGFVLAGSVLSSLVVLVALSAELQHDLADPVPQMVLAAISLVLSWLFMNTMFALHYAHTYYGDGERPTGGLLFPATLAPDYWDFVYFSFVLGMTFQVSDVQITDRNLRQIALAHGVLAFFFNVVVIALTVNAIATSG